MTTRSGLGGRRVGITADRRWRAQADLLENLGAEIVHGPTIRTVDLSGDEALRRATLDLIDRPPDYLVGSTGMGMTMWLEAVVDFLTGQGIGAARVALQLFDPGGHPSTAALAARSGELVEVPVYRWLMPDDTGPASRLVEEMCAGAVDAVTFTSQPAVHHLFRIAEDIGRADDLRAACNDAVLPVCVGPVCADAARAEGITRPAWPDPPRLAAMIRLVASELGPRFKED